MLKQQIDVKLPGLYKIARLKLTYLVEGGQVYAGVEADEEHQFDQQTGVDEHVGEPGPEPGHARTPLLSS